MFCFWICKPRRTEGQSAMYRARELGLFNRVNSQRVLFLLDDVLTDFADYNWWIFNMSFVRLANIDLWSIHSMNLQMAWLTTVITTRTSETLYHCPRTPIGLQHFQAWKFRDDISNGSVAIVLTDKQTDKQTNTHYWKQYHPRCAGSKYSVIVIIISSSCYTWWVKKVTILRFSGFFPKRLGIFRPNFSCLLYVSIYDRRQILIQLSGWSYAILSSTTQHAFRPMMDIFNIWWWSPLIWHNFVKVATCSCRQLNKICSPA